MTTNCVGQYLSKGRYLVIGRPPTEDQLIKRLPGAISNQVGIYHYAKPTFMTTNCVGGIMVNVFT
jgi:hypothetical protein